MHPAKAKEPWSGDRLESTEFHEIAEICKTGIRQLLRSPYETRITRVECCMLVVPFVEFATHAATCNVPLKSVVGPLGLAISGPR
jgi:hypothetical protein